MSDPSAENGHAAPKPTIVLSLDGDTLNLQAPSMAPEIIEAVLLRALAFMQREILIARLTQRERGVQVLKSLPRIFP